MLPFKNIEPRIILRENLPNGSILSRDLIWPDRSLGTFMPGTLNDTDRNRLRIMEPASNYVANDASVSAL